MGSRETNTLIVVWNYTIIENGKNIVKPVIKRIERYFWNKRNNYVKVLWIQILSLTFIKKNGATACQKKAHRIAISDYNDAYRDMKFLDSNITIHNTTKPIGKKKKLILKTSKRKMKEIMLCFKKSQKIQKQNNNNNNKIKNGDDEHVIKSKHDDYEEKLICDETITNDNLFDEIYWPCS